MRGIVIGTPIAHRSTFFEGRFFFMTNHEALDWLRSFHAHPRNSAEVPGDDLGTTFGHCGAVILGVVLTSTRSPEPLAELIGLPVTFTAVVLANMDYNQLWNSESFHELRRTIHVNPNDHEDIEDALESFLEDFWNESKLPGMEMILPALRGVSLLFGRTQTWINEFES